MTQITLQVLENKIENLTQKVEEGFKGVHSRQDAQNGTLNNHSKFITDLQKEDIRIENKFKNTKVLWYVITTSFTIISFLIGVVLTLD
jgi:hypothetical protein